MKEFKIRCHAISKIMAGEIGITETQQARINELMARRKGEGKPLTPNMDAELDKLIYKQNNPELPQGAKTYCKMWLKSTLFNRKPEWKAIVVDKGLQCELEGINHIATTFGYTDFEKNDEYFENEFMEGTPDIIHDAMVRDTKLSWDLFTFPMFDDKLENEDYYYQLQGYMILTGLEKASLDYVLIDTPKALIDQDLKKLYFQSGGKAEDWTPETYEILGTNYSFSDIEPLKRIKSFQFSKDSSLESKIKERVLLCRKYIDTLNS